MRIFHNKYIGPTLSKIHMSDDSFIKTALHRFLKQKTCLWGGCQESFYNDYECYLHLKKVHKPTKSHVCHWRNCQYQSQNMNNNINHIKKHFDLVQGICLSCSATFKWKFDLKRHLKNIHKDNNIEYRSINIIGMKILITEQKKILNDKISFLLN